MQDAELLRDYVTSGSDAAFAELVDQATPGTDAQRKDSGISVSHRRRLVECRAKRNRRGIESRNGEISKEIFPGRKNKLRRGGLNRISGVSSVPAQFVSDDGLSLQ